MPGPRHQLPPGRRLLVLVVLLVALLLALVVRLGQAQLTDDPRFTGEAAAVVTRTVTIPAIRGRILDRQGRPLAENTAVTAVAVDRAALSNPERGRELIGRLAQVLGLDAADLYARTQPCGEPGAAARPRCWEGSPYSPVVLTQGIDPTRALTVADRSAQFPGVSVTTVPVRNYPGPDGVNAAHLIGYLGRVTQAEIDAADGALTDTDLVGRSGLEQSYDQILRGRPGISVVQIDARGVPVRELSHTDPVPGRDLLTSIDAPVQAATERALAETIAARRAAKVPADTGAAVVLDVRSGAVVALASYPTYDPSIWVGGISSDDFAALTAKDADEPILDRAISAAMPPASTFKVVTLPALVRAGNPLTGKYDCPGSYRIGDRQFDNYESRTYGLMSLHQAIEVSCDTIFYDAAYRNWLALGGTGSVAQAAATDARDVFVDTALGFGLGTITGIDLPGETAGRIPDRVWKASQWQATKQTLCQRAKTGYPEVSDPERAAFLTQIAAENCTHGYEYRAGDAANFSIGQGDVLTTPLQMTQAIAAIATGGIRFAPRVVSAYVDPLEGTKESLDPARLADVPLDPTVGSYLRDALAAVPVSGTAAEGFRGFPLSAWPVAGKTGTAEVFGKETTSWFVSYAPANDPAYAVAVAITNAGDGSQAAVPASVKIHQALLAAEGR